MSKNKVLVAMSGGVDSSVAAALLKKQGYEVIGIHLQLWDYGEANFKKSGGSCCSIADTNDARRVCDILEIPYYVINFREEFKTSVVDYFVSEYLQARTPNPCVMCNNKLKFSHLVTKADELNCHWVATGHYARLLRNEKDFKTEIYKAKDLKKDQSYFLFGLKSAQLCRVLMPLGDLLKEQVRALATEFKLPVADKKDSQEICFIDESGYKQFVAERLTSDDKTVGQIITEEGEVVGQHQGLFRYTIGQKKGLELNSPQYQNFFVIAFDTKANALVVGPEERLFKKELKAARCNWLIDHDWQKGEVQAFAKIRSRQLSTACTVTIDKDLVKVTFEQAQRAVTPGQAIVFYQGDQLIGGGWIEGP